MTATTENPFDLGLVAGLVAQRTELSEWHPIAWSLDPEAAGRLPPVAGDPRRDEDAIAKVLLRYATGVDRRDWDAFRTCFTGDVVAEYDGIGTWRSAEEITEFMRQVHAGAGPTLHQITNLVIDVDGGTAAARCYVQALVTGLDGGSGVQAFGYYDDALVRTADGWRIARRRFTSVSMRTVEA